MRAYLVATLLLLIIFGMIGGYLYQRFSAMASMDFSTPPVTIAAAWAKEQSWQQILHAVGTVQAVRGIELTSETSGQVTDIRFKSGEHVQKGQLLVILNDEIEQASRRNQTASLELSQILFDRDSQLIDQNTIPQSQYDQSKADLARAKAQLWETDARLANKRITAPFSGIMGIRHIDVGDYVSPGTVIANLQDHEELEIDFAVPSRYAPNLRDGLKVDVRIDAFVDKLFSATVIAVDSKVDPSTRNILLRARLDQTSDLLPGMFATLKVNFGDQIDVVTVPETAVTYSLQGDTVYVIQEKAEGSLTAIAKVVKSGDVRNGQVAISSGLSPGDRVVTAGQNKLYTGVTILVDESVKF